MRTISDTVHIDATPSEVWAVLADTDAYGDWNTVMPSLTGRLAPGERIKARMRPPGAPPLSVKATIEDATPGERLSWRGGAAVPGLLDGHHEFTLTPSTQIQGGTHLVQSETFTGALVPLAGFLLTRLERGYAQMDEQLKKRAESRRGASGVGR